VTTRLLTLITSLVLSYYSFELFAEEQPGEESLLKAVFIYNFAKFTRWPDEAWNEKGPSLQICTIGYDPLANALLRLHGKTLRDHPVNIELKENTAQLNSCHVLYLANTLTHEAIQITQNLHAMPILTISEIPSFSKSGGMIELYHSDDRIRFKINLTIIREAGLDLSSRLLKLATIVHTQQ
jgi:hypothetical protein